MNYSDPHHKRIEARPATFCAKTEDGNKCLLFTGPGEHEAITVRECGKRLITTVAGEVEEVVIWKIQLMERLNWLILDFEHNPRLSRIVVYVEKFSADDLNNSLMDLIGNRSILYYRHG